MSDAQQTTTSPTPIMPSTPPQQSWLKKIKLVGWILFGLMVALFLVAYVVGKFVGTDSAPIPNTTTGGNEDASILSYIQRNTELTSTDWESAAGQTYLIRSFLEADNEYYCVEFQSSELDYTGAGMTVEEIISDEEAFDTYNNAAGDQALDSMSALGSLLSDGSTLAEVCMKGEVLYVTAVSMDEQTVTPYEFDAEDGRFYAFDPILTADGYHQFLFDLVPEYITFLSISGDSETGVDWEFYALDPVARSADLLERCSRAEESEGTVVTACDREWKYAK